MSGIGSFAGAARLGMVAALSAVVIGAAEAHAQTDEAAAPQGLSAKRTAQGIYLTWSDSLTGVVGIWRGTAPGSLRLLAQVPAGQAGFLDLKAGREETYRYALGGTKEHGAAIVVGGVAPVKVLAGLVTTCSGLTKGSPYPANTRNYFSPARDVHVQYYGYFLIRPFDGTPRSVRLVWRDPEGDVFSEYEGTVTPRRVDLAEGPAGGVLLAQAIGLKHSLPQNGQKRIPQGEGVCTVEALIDGVPAGLTVFHLGGGRAAPPEN